MARWLLNCQQLCGHPWLLGLATEPEERDAAYRLRYDIFFRECGYGAARSTDGRDTDSFDAWCDHLILWDSERAQLVGTYRAISGAEAGRRGGFYGASQFDYAPLEPIANRILQGGRTCVAADYRTGPAIQYLSYGMELLRREYGCEYFLGAESFQADNVDEVSAIHSYLGRYGMDPEWRVEPWPANRVVGLRDVPIDPSHEARLPSVIRADLRMGFRACGPPSWDPDFRSYDVLMLGRYDRLTRVYHGFINRIERIVRSAVQPLPDSRLGF